MCEKKSNEDTRKVKTIFSCFYITKLLHLYADSQNMEIKISTAKTPKTTKYPQT